jgi:hypothetical protein
MCNGIAKMKCSQDSEIELTAAPKSQQSANRKVMCPKGWCANGVKEYIKNFYPTGIPSWAQDAITAAADMSCDEFPFARSHEGGSLDFGTRICIPASENSWQGGTMSSFFKKYLNKAKTITNPNYIAPNEKFVIKIVGWDCATMQPAASSKQRKSLARRDVFNIDVTVSGGKRKEYFHPESVLNVSPDEMYSSFDPSNPNMKMATMPLGDLRAGSYIVSLTIAKGNLSISVVDYSGETYDSTTLPDGSISFTLTEDTDAVALIGMTTDDDVQVVYHARSTNASTSASATISTSTQAVTQSSNSRRLQLSSHWCWLRAMASCLLVLL